MQINESPDAAVSREVALCQRCLVFCLPGDTAGILYVLFLYMNMMSLHNFVTLASALQPAVMIPLSDLERDSKTGQENIFNL